MTKAEIFAELERRLGPLDETVKQVVDVTLALVGQPDDDAPSVPPLAFQGENPPFEEMAALDIDTRSHVMQELEDRNQQWLERQCKELNAHWLVVVDGQVIAHGGPGLGGLAIDERVPAVGQQTGKFPLVFIHSMALAIEETPWHVTATAGDFYPTLPLTLENGGVRLPLIGDFDTGANALCTDAERLERVGLISIGQGDRLRRAAHLNASFTYVVKTLTVTLTADSASQQAARDVVCVRNWHQSPFVTISPNRTARAGRDARPYDCAGGLAGTRRPYFAQRETSLQW
jgi:hypothetical protein